MSTNFDPTTNRIPFGLLEPEEQEALKAWPHGWEVFMAYEWRLIDAPSWTEVYVYRGLPEPMTQDEIPWEILEDWVQWAARDEGGTLWAYGRKPLCLAEIWQEWQGDYVCLDAVKIKRGTCDWKDSLQKRPKGV